MTIMVDYSMNSNDHDKNGKQCYMDRTQKVLQTFSTSFGWHSLAFCATYHNLYLHLYRTSRVYYEIFMYAPDSC